MDNAALIFWLVCFYCAVGIFKTIRLYGRISTHGLVVYTTILLVAVLGRCWHRDTLVYASAVLWALLILTPGLLSLRCHRLVLQFRYAEALRLGRVICLLHPTLEWRQQMKILRAFHLAELGDLNKALEILEPLKGNGSTGALNAVCSYYRLLNQWDEFLAFEAEHRTEFEKGVQFLSMSLRARGETGDVRGMVELYQRRKSDIERMQPVTQADICRLALFAFCGQKARVETLLRARLALFPVRLQQLWLATAEMAAGQSAIAKQHLEELMPDSTPPVRALIQRRLAQIETGAGIARDFDESILAQAATDHEHSELFGPRLSVTSPRARGTLILILLNLAMFGVEMWKGSSTDGETLYRLGAVFAPAILEGGQWWRLLTSCFLHAGIAHLSLNMLGLWILGPIAEYSLGWRRFLALYLLSGVGAMGMMTLMAHGPREYTLGVGASGAIMGLVGVLGAIMMRGWLRHRAVLARKRLFSVLAIIVLQTLFDSVMPQVSMTAHLTGTALGFALALCFGNRLLGERVNSERSLA